MNRRQYDKTYLSSKSSYVMNQQVTHVNNNEAIIAPTGNGKSTSFVEPRLLNAEHQSYVVPVTKRILADQYKPYLESKGYNVQILDLAHPSQSEVGFNPMKYLKTEQDIIWLTNNIINTVPENSHADLYWSEAATSVFAAEIQSVAFERKGRKFSLKDVITFHNGTMLREDKGKTVTNRDMLFSMYRQIKPNSLAARGWNQLISNPFKTASNIFTMVHNRVDKIFNSEILELSEYKKQVDITKMAEEKTVLFIINSPVTLCVQNYANLVYSILFKVLFEYAERQMDYSLPVPVHFILDDGCNSSIPDLDLYISIFRAIGASVTINLQSQNQLYNLYGKEGGDTILSNCDTFVFGRTNELNTLNDLAKRLNKPIEDVHSIAYDQFVIVRTGESPRIEQRYQTYEDPNYQTMMSMYQESLNKKQITNKKTKEVVEETESLS